jgi:hypothetical protein
MLIYSGAHCLNCSPAQLFASSLAFSLRHNLLNCPIYLPICRTLPSSLTALLLICSSALLLTCLPAYLLPAHFVTFLHAHFLTSLRTYLFVPTLHTCSLVRCSPSRWLIGSLAYWLTITCVSLSHLFPCSLAHFLIHKRGIPIFFSFFRPLSSE